VEVSEKFNVHASRMVSRVSDNLSVIEDFCGRLEVLTYGVKAVQHYGAIRAHVEKLGRPIGVNDLQIAGHARSEGLVLVTNNLAEFEPVPALKLENWVQPSRTRSAPGQPMRGTKGRPVVE